MSPAQAALMRDVIEADSNYRRLVALGDPAVERDWRGVECSVITGHKRVTALSLAVAGLVELVEVAPGRFCAFLGTYDR